MKRALFFISVIFFVTNAIAQQEINISNSMIDTCDAIIYDDGGPNGNYSETDYTMTVCAATGSDLFVIVNELLMILCCVLGLLMQVLLIYLLFMKVLELLERYFSTLMSIHQKQF